MSKTKLSKIIKRELSMLNETIDWKIVKGLPYQREALRHKMLRRQLAAA